MSEAVQVDNAKLISDFEGFLRKIYYKELIEAANSGKVLVIEFKDLDEYNTELSDFLLKKPGDFYTLAEKCQSHIDLPEKVRIRIKGLPESVSIRDLRAVHIDKFISIEGVVRKASEIRPEILSTTWECPECGTVSVEERKAGFIFSPKWCDCGNRKGFKQIEKNMVDTRWVVIEEPFELTEGERPSQVTIMLTEDLANQYGRRISDPGNRLKITGVLKDIPKAKMFSAKLDFFLDANHVEPTEIGWSKIELKEEDIEEIKKLSKDQKIYNMFVASLAPTLYGMKEIKEAIILQIFGGVHRKMVDGTKSRGDIHVLLVGDPAAGKCVSGDTKVILNTGEVRNIEEIVENKMESNKTKINDGFYAKGNDDIVSMSLKGKAEQTKANIFWKRESPKFLYRIMTAKGKEITVTPTHPFFICDSGMISSKKASDIKKGDFIATPSKINVSGKPQEIKIKIAGRRTNKHMKVPKNTSPEFCKFIAYVLAEGYVQKGKSTSLVWFTNDDNDILKDYEKSASLFGLKLNKRKPHKSKSSWDYYISSVELVEFLESLEPKMLSRSSEKKVPPLLLKCSDSEVRAFLQAFFDSEAHVEKSGIELSSASKEMLEQIQVMLLRFGIVSSLKSKWGQATNSKKPVKRKYHRIFISGTNLEKFKSIGFISKRKSHTLSKLPKKESITDTIPDLSKLLKKIRKKTGISQFGMGIPRTTYQHFERGDRQPTKNSLRNICKALDKHKIPEIEALKQITNSDIYWDKITGIKKFRSNQKWVYDLQVPEVHNFIGNNIFVHNSQLLKLVPEIIPRGRYVSGKGATGAGLTASVTKDEQFMGGWVLEAGAMVLTHKGMLAVDEFEKMSNEDQVSMHEAMEQGTISIAKASIVATLPAQTSILAGGNPKFSRFDPYLPISKQITIPDTLLSRFDLKFILKDVADSERDKKVIDHIVSSREEGYEAAKPLFDKEFIRKYIAYAKEHCKPEMSREASKILKTFYINTRKQAEGGNAPMPITLRQFEALLRLSEASAKVQLSNVVREEDAQRAIKLMRFSLMEVGFDPETGQIDVDRSEGMTSQSERSKIRIVLDLINELSKERKEISMKDLEENAQKRGIENIDEFIEKLKREGLLFEPNPGYVQKV